MPIAESNSRMESVSDFEQFESLTPHVFFCCELFDEQTDEP